MLLGTTVSSKIGLGLYPAHSHMCTSYGRFCTKQVNFLPAHLGSMGQKREMTRGDFWLSSFPLSRLRGPGRQQSGSYQADEEGNDRPRSCRKISVCLSHWDSSPSPVATSPPSRPSAQFTCCSLSGLHSESAGRTRSSSLDNEESETRFGRIRV